MTGDAAADLHSDLARGQVDFVMKHGDVIEPYLVEMHGLGNGPAGFVHIGPR